MPGSAHLLKQVDIFYQVPVEQLERITAIAREASYQAGETIFAEGSNSDELFIILQGEVEILLDPGLTSLPIANKTPVPIATLRRGQSFGEIALVDQGVRSATARAGVEGTRLLVIPGAELVHMCSDHPQLGYLLMRNLAADLAMKLRNTDLLIRQELLEP